MSDSPESSPTVPHISPRSLPKKKFTEQDDEKLKQVIQEIGTKSWIEVANRMGDRNPRQCKERWENYLNPSINNNPFTKEEDELLIRKQKELGSKWVTISHFFERRTDAAVKNRWQMLDRKEKKLKKLLEKQKNGKGKDQKAKGQRRKQTTERKAKPAVLVKSTTLEPLLQDGELLSFTPAPEILFNLEEVPTTDVVEDTWNFMERPDIYVDFL